MISSGTSAVNYEAYEYYSYFLLTALQLDYIVLGSNVISSAKLSIFVSSSVKS